MKTDSAVPKVLKQFIWLPARIVMIAILGKQNVDYIYDRKTEHFKALTSNSHSSAIADYMTQTGHRRKWDHFDILATGL